MQTGIIGLPQSGKTTLFRILTRAHLDEKAARAVTHVGVARVPEPRLAQLAAIYHPPKITYATVEYVDVGGISRDRKRDSSVLAPLREVDALAHVLRVFDDPSVPHAAGSVDALRDAVSLDLELMLSDLDQIERRIERVEKDLKKKKETVLEFELALLQRCRTAIQAETPLRELPFTPEEKKALTGFMFLSARPMLYVLNLGDDEAPQLDSAVQRHGLEKLAGRPQSAVIAVCGRIEAELAELEDAAAAELLAAYGLKEPGLHRLIRATYDLLGLIQFFTAGEPEVRAWTIPRGTTAVKAAGAIHTDIERGFIRAEVVRCEDLLAAGSIPAAREKAQVRLEGKDYVVQEGDVILFRHSG
jgi:ribosome-binding ATPase